jgi:5-methylcytosine-specific restriction endonuclease McrA
MTVLVLNQDFEPLNVAGVRRALVLIDKGKAEVLEFDPLPIRTPARELDRPSVIRLKNYVKRPRPRLAFSRRGVLLRDAFTCQYCGRQGSSLTLDHETPRRLGGRETWENLVTACRPCNQRKGGRTPDEARMPLRRHPFEPRATVTALFPLEVATSTEWRPYLGLVESA